MNTHPPARFSAPNHSTCEALLRFAAGNEDDERASYQFMCECSIDDCEESISLTLPAYRAARELASTRLVAADHVASEDASRVDERDGYWIIYG
jgi:hypothetical protein